MLDLVRTLVFVLLFYFVSCFGLLLLISYLNSWIWVFGLLYDIVLLCFDE